MRKSRVTRTRFILWVTLFMPAASVKAAELEEPAKLPPLNSFETKTGVKYTVLGENPINPAPTLIVLAGAAEDTIGDRRYLRCGNFLIEKGYFCVSLDLPCHGAQRGSEPEGLLGWRKRIEAGVDPIVELNDRLSKLLDHLISARHADPKLIAVCGTSRGGFAALHFAAVDPRVRCVVAYAPVTDLAVLREFQGTEENELVRRLKLTNQASKLATRPVWITIGDRDERVGTDRVIEFARRLSTEAAAINQPGNVELHVCPSKGHATPSGAEEQSAAWIEKHR